MGGSAEAITETVRRGYQPGMDLAAAVRLAVRSLSTDGGPNVAPRELGASALEVAILDRTRVLPRKFRRIHGTWLTGLLADGPDVRRPPDPGPEAPPGRSLRRRCARPSSGTRRSEHRSTATGSAAPPRAVPGSW